MGHNGPLGPPRADHMAYPESFVAPMREELTRLGIEELRTAEAVDATVKNATGTLMVVVNSICGCAAGKARPGIALALQHSVRPDRIATVFAGADLEATDRARSYFTGYTPSSPSIGLLRDGKLVCGCSSGDRSRIKGQSKSRARSPRPSSSSVAASSGRSRNVVRA